MSRPEKTATFVPRPGAVIAAGKGGSVRLLSPVASDRTEADWIGMALDGDLELGSVVNTVAGRVTVAWRNPVPARAAP